MSAQASDEPTRGPDRGIGLGGGLLRGLATTARTLLRPAHTAEYPDVQPELPPRSRGVIALLQENCTVCMLCARECPDWCIYIDSHKETLPAVGGGRARQRNVLDRFAIDFSLCMYCGICIEVCPFDALFWSPEFEYAEFDILDLVHEKERLSGWLASVPPPPQLDQGAEESKEVAASARRIPADPEQSPPVAPESQPSTEPTGLRLHPRQPPGPTSTQPPTEPPTQPPLTGGSS
ncbi:MAG: 4Fe-4S binding protein [Kineosporiaceae bacterium]|nr:4Fe-4S binding protein [Kineosporiaceae bacterium]